MRLWLHFFHKNAHFVWILSLYSCISIFKFNGLECAMCIYLKLKLTILWLWSNWWRHKIKFRTQSTIDHGYWYSGTEHGHLSVFVYFNCWRATIGFVYAISRLKFAVYTIYSQSGLQIHNSPHGHPGPLTCMFHYHIELKTTIMLDTDRTLTVVRKFYCRLTVYIFDDCCEKVKLRW